MLRRTFVLQSFAASAGLGLAAGTWPAWAQAPAVALPDAAVAPGKLAFAAKRNGSDIGRYVAEIARNGDQTIVTSETSIAVKVLVITAYRFEQRTREVWRGTNLLEFSATTNDDGTKNQIEGKSDGRTLQLTVDGRPVTLQPPLVPASLWNPRLVQQSKLFDTADGRPLNINVKLVAEEPLTIRGSAVKARRYAFTGDMVRDIWYDANWTPVQASFLANKDKSEIRLTLA